MKVPRREFFKVAAATAGCILSWTIPNSLVDCLQADASTEQNEQSVATPIDGGILFCKSLVGDSIEVIEISNRESSPRKILEYAYGGGFALDVRGNNIAILPSGYTQLPNIEIWGIRERDFVKLRGSYLNSQLSNVLKPFLDHCDVTYPEYGLDSVCLTTNVDVQIAASRKFCSGMTHQPLLIIRWSNADTCSLEALTKDGSLGMGQESLDTEPKVSPDGTHVLYKYQVRSRCRDSETYDPNRYPEELRLVDIETRRTVPLKMEADDVFGNFYTWLSPQTFALVELPQP